MKYRVSFRPRAKADLIALYDYISEEAGYVIAGEYIDRIEDACLSLIEFPKRGMQRDDISPGMRTIGFERRATIAFRVFKDEVVIIRIFYGGRNYEPLLRGIGDE